MAVAGFRITVASTATAIVAADFDGGAFSIRNRDADSVFLGGAAVTAAAGYELGAGESIGVQLDQGDALYGITASGTARVDVLSAG